MKKRNIHICFVAPNTNEMIGGISTWYQIIVNSIKNEYDISCINTNPKYNPIIKQTSINRYLSSFFRVFGQKKELKSYLKNKLDVVHIATSGGFGFFRDFQLLKTAKRQNVKTILHLHFGSTPDILERKRGFIYRFFKKCISLSDVIISIDQKTEQSLNDNNITNVLVPNPVIDYKNDYNINSKNIIFVGNVLPTKGIEELISSFMCFKKSNSDWTLQIIGPYDAKYYNYLKEKYDLNGIVFLGSLDHLTTISYIKASSFLVLPSYTEGMPNVILEAMSCGVPCIATCVGNIPNMLDGYGILIKPKSSLELECALSKMASDDSLRFFYSQNSYKRAISEYSVLSVIKKLDKIWCTNNNGSSKDVFN